MWNELLADDEILSESNNNNSVDLKGKEDSSVQHGQAVFDKNNNRHNFVSILEEWTWGEVGISTV